MAGDITRGYWARMLRYYGLSPTAFAGSSSGSTLLQASAVASGTLTLPAATDTLVGKATTDILTNKTITGAIETDIKRCSAQKDTITTALADVTGLTGQVLVAGATYKFRCVLPGTSDTTSGISYGFNYTTATLTSIESTSLAYTASAVAVAHSTTTTDQALLVDTAGVRILCVIEGTMVVNAGGTLALQVGTHTGTTTASVYAGATMEFNRVA